MKVDWIERLGTEPITLTEAMKLIGDTEDYYVYILWRRYDDPPVPFYVGKGHKGRLPKHTMASEEDKNIYKTRVLQKHKRLGIDCGYSIGGFFEDENDALDAERSLIAQIGRKDKQQGPLTNRTDGGDGTLGHFAPKRGKSASARPVSAKGIRYSCLEDAADALGVTAGAISSRIKNGWKGYFYEDEGQRPQRVEILGRYRKPVSILGQQFSSASEAARELGMDVRMISKRIQYGWPGYYYIKEGQLPRKTIWGSREDKVGVIVRGRRYETVAEASRATGESIAKISKRCLSSNYPEYSRVDGRQEEKAALPKTPEPILIGHLTFSSVGDAARAHNLTSGAVHHRCQSSNYPAWRYKDPEKQRVREVETNFSSIPIEVEVNGVKYESQSAAARFHGIDINTAKKRFRSTSFPTWVCHGVEKQVPRDGRKGLITVEIDGRLFRSISSASRALNIPRAEIRKRLDSPEWRNFKLSGPSS